MSNQWLVPPVSKPLPSKHSFIIELSGIEGVAHKVVGGFDYMENGSVIEWEMVDGVRVDKTDEQK